MTRFIGSLLAPLSTQYSNTVIAAGAKLGLEGVDGDFLGITSLVADFLNSAWDTIINAVRTVLYVLLTIPLMITGALSDAVDIVAGIKPVYTASDVIMVPYAGTIPPCKYDDFIVFDTFYQVTNSDIYKNHGDGTLNKDRYNFRETVPGPLVGNWVPYGDTPDDREMLNMYYAVRPDIRNGDFISDFLHKTRYYYQMMSTNVNHWDSNYNAPIAFPAPYQMGGQTYYGKSLDKNQNHVDYWKGEEAYRFTSNKDFADYYIAHSLYRNGYEPNGYKFESQPELMPYYISSKEALELNKSNSLNIAMRSMSSRITYGDGSKESDKWQFSGYNSDFFAHVSCRQLYYYTHWSGGLVRSVKNYYSLMFLYSAVPLWKDYINFNEDLAVSPGNGNPRNWSYWTPEFQKFIGDNDLLPGTDDMYRFTASWIAEGKQLQSVYQENQERGETLLSIIMGQSVVSYVFWGITLISAALCLFFTIFAVVRSIGDLGLKRPIGKVMGDAGRAMLTFLLVPMLVIIAVNVSTTVLRQVNVLMDNAITGDRENESNLNMSTAIFYTALTPQSMLFAQEETAALEQYAGTPKGDEIKRHGYQATASERNIKLADTQRKLLDGTLDWQAAGLATTDIDPLGMNYLPTLLSAWFSAIIMTMILVLFIRRMYEVVLLYIAAPFFVSAIPLDEGNKFKAWREMFIAKTVQGFSSIITLKLYLMLIPLLWNGSVSFHRDATLDGMLKLIFMAGALFAAYKSHTLITGIFSRQAEGMERETAAFTQQVLKMGKDVAMIPATIVKEDVQEKIADKKGEMRQSVAQGITDTNASIRKGIGTVAAAPFKAASNAFRKGK